MQEWRKTSIGQTQIDVLLFEQFSNHALANSIEPLRVANTVLRRQAYAWRILTPDDRPVVSSSGLPVSPTASFADRLGGSILMVLPSYGVRAHATSDCLAALRAAARRYDVIAGLDMGSWLMAAAGLLSGQQATIHYDELDAFAEAFPEVHVVRRRWVQDGNRLTCGGAMASFEMVQALIGATHGMAVALEVGAVLMASGPVRQTDRRATGDPLVDAAVARMEGAVETPVPISDLARALGISTRDLSRRFTRRLGASPGTVYRRIRLGVGRRLAEQAGMSIAESAARTGYADASAFTRAFRREFGETPSVSRQVR